MYRNSTRRMAVAAKVTSVAGCIGMILHGPAMAAAPSGELEEIVVSASRRDETVSKAPYNISAYSGDQLQSANITNVAALSQQVPNFVIQETGARDAGMAVPVIRGLNASSAVLSTDQPRFFQSAVGMYLGNTPLIGSLPLMDVERVEVLRGPQGTLYGAGTLAGAVRIAPVEPKLGAYSGSASVAGATVAHSGSLSYDGIGTVNLPLGDTAALRLVAKNQYDAGFIDQNDIMRRQGDEYANGAPILATPGDIANSPGVYYSQKDSNWTRTSSARASLLWQGSDAFKLKVSYDYSRLNGYGSPQDNPSFGGGVVTRFNDGGRVRKATGEYEISHPVLEPFERTTHLASADPSLDLGFATLSGTFSYGKTDGKNVFDNTLVTMGFTEFTPYYAGTPFNPRFIDTQFNGDSGKTTTQELRLVSNGTNTIDYVAGIYLQQEKHTFIQQIYVPGTEAYTQVVNTIPVIPDAAGRTTNYVANQDYKEFSVYGNLTWHVTDRWQATGGARIFRETFNQEMDQIFPLFGIETIDNQSSKLTSQIFMLNTSYDLTPSVKVYGTWSQGFRRGGANTFPLDGPFPESALIRYYTPDKTNNFEVGLKGRVNGYYFAASVFYVRWNNPQIDLLTPHLQYPVVVNGKSADSKGIELETSGPLGAEGLTFNLGIGYAKARLTGDFALPAGLGGGTFEPAGIAGQDGDRLPGTPDLSGTANLNYALPLANGSKLTFSLGADYRSSTVTTLPHIALQTSATEDAYALFHGDIEWNRGNWRYSLYGTNLTDKRVEYSRNVRLPENVLELGNFGNAFTISHPRELGVRVSFKW